MQVIKYWSKIVSFGSMWQDILRTQIIDEASINNSNSSLQSEQVSDGSRKVCKSV